MPDLLSTECCGVREIDGVRDLDLYPERYFWEEIRNGLQNLNDYDAARELPAKIVFTDAKDDRRRRQTCGERLAGIITRKNLGEVIETGWQRNPNSGNKVNLWVWNINKRNLFSFLEGL